MNTTKLVNTLDTIVGMKLFFDEKYEDAIIEFSQVLEKQFLEPRSLIYRAICYSRLGQYRKALTEFAKGFKNAKKDTFDSISEIDFILENLYECQINFLPQVKKLHFVSTPLSIQAFQEKLDQLNIQIEELPYLIPTRLARAEIWSGLYAPECSRCELEVAQWLSHTHLSDPKFFKKDQYDNAIKLCDILEAEVIPELLAQEKQSSLRFLAEIGKRIKECILKEDFSEAEQKYLHRILKIDLLANKACYKMSKSLIAEYKDYLNLKSQLRDAPTDEIAFEQIQLTMSTESLIENNRFVFAEALIDSALRISENNTYAWYMASLLYFNKVKFLEEGREKSAEETHQEIQNPVEETEKRQYIEKAKEAMDKGEACLQQPNTYFQFLLAFLYFRINKTDDAFFHFIQAFLVDKENVIRVFKDARTHITNLLKNDATLFAKKFLGAEKHLAKNILIKRLMEKLKQNEHSPSSDCLELADKWTQLKKPKLALFFKAMAFWLISIKMDKIPKISDLEKFKEIIVKQAAELAQNDVAHSERYLKLITLLGKSVPIIAPPKQINLQDSAFNEEKKPNPVTLATQKKKKANARKLKQKAADKKSEQRVPAQSKTKDSETIKRPVIKPVIVAETKSPAVEEKKATPHKIKACYLEKIVTYPESILNVFEKFDTERVYVVGGWMCKALSPPKEEKVIDAAITLQDKEEKETAISLQDVDTDIDITFGIKEKDGLTYLKKRFPDAKITKLSTHDFVIEIFKPYYLKADAHHSEALSNFSLPELEAIAADAEGRDFRANALYGKKPTEGKKTGIAIDGTSRGHQDLIDGRLKSIKKMEESFAFDFVRALRALHFKTKRQWKITDPMLTALKGIKETVINNAFKINPGSINHWILKLFTPGRANKNFLLLDITNLLKKMFPEFCEAFEKPSFSKQQMTQYMLKLENASSARNDLNYIYATWVIFVSRNSGKNFDEVIEANPLFGKNFEFFDDKKAWKSALFSEVEIFYINFFETIKPKGPREPAFTADDYRQHQEQKQALNYARTFSPKPAQQVVTQEHAHPPTQASTPEIVRG